MPTFLQDEAIEKLNSGIYGLPGMLLLSSLVAFACNLASVQLILTTSAVVLSLVGVLKDLLILFFSVVVFRSPVTIVQMCSYLVTLVILNVYKEYKNSPKDFAARVDAALLQIGVGQEEGIFTRWALREEAEGAALMLVRSNKSKDSTKKLLDIEGSE